MATGHSTGAPAPASFRPSKFVDGALSASTGSPHVALSFQDPAGRPPASDEATRAEFTNLLSAGVACLESAFDRLPETAHAGLVLLRQAKYLGDRLEETSLESESPATSWTGSAAEMLSRVRQLLRIAADRAEAEDAEETLVLIQAAFAAAEGDAPATGEVPVPADSGAGLRSADGANSAEPPKSPREKWGDAWPGIGAIEPTPLELLRRIRKCFRKVERLLGDDRVAMPDLAFNSVLAVSRAGTALIDREIERVGS